VSEALRKDSDQDYRKYIPFCESDYNFFFLLYLTQNAMFRARHHELLKIGLTHTEFMLLKVVEGLGGVTTPAEISRWMRRKPPTTTGLLNRMERNGLIRRIADSKNKKLKKVIITKKGQEALERAMQHNIMRDIICSMSEVDYRQLWLLLESLKDKALLLTGTTETDEGARVV